MDNVLRSDYGRAVIEYSEHLTDNHDEVEGVARDTITNILHHLVRAEYIDLEKIHILLGTCAHNVEEELAKEEE